MAKYTENYNLEKPEKTEHYDIETANKNNDILDARLFEKQDKQAGKGLSTNDFTDEYKKKIDALQRIYKYCGSVETVADLDTIEERQIGDVYNVKDTNIDYCWNGTEWTELGNAVDLTNYQTTEQANQDKQKIKDKLVVVSATEPTGDNRKKVWIQKGKNLLGTSYVTETTMNGVTITKNTNGTLTLNGTCSGNFPVTILNNVSAILSNIYTFSLKVHSGSMTGGSVRISINNTISSDPTSTTGRLLSFVWVSGGINGSDTQQVSDKAQYLSMYVNKGCVFNNCNISLQIEQGSTATEYEEYIEPKIYVKNDNDVYEEFVKNEDKNILTVGMSSDYTSMSKSQEKISLNTIINKEGNRLTLSDGSITIGKNINKIKVFGQVTIEGGMTSGDRIMIQIKKNSENVCISETVVYGNYQTFNINGNLANVVEGDIISLYIYTITNSGAKVIATQTHTYITVESI